MNPLFIKAWCYDLEENTIFSFFKLVYQISENKYV